MFEKISAVDDADRPVMLIQHGQGMLVALLLKNSMHVVVTVAREIHRRAFGAQVQGGSARSDGLGGTRDGG
ncbi:hypothetical protein D560_3657 [Bordetella holmesii ATCC 51541]|nr:hypothetical protein D560_3657 [Bordetella holmesii ATCC 51541]